MLAMVVNDDAFILERTRRLQVHRQQAGACSERCADQNLCKREPLAIRGITYQVNRYRVVVLHVSK
ncbi:hypothetical protein EMIT0P218_170028 [Pseudomonas sp. IT-P218]